MYKTYSSKSIIFAEDFAKSHSLKENVARNILMNKATSGRCLVVFRFKTNQLAYNSWTIDVATFYLLK